MSLFGLDQCTILLVLLVIAVLIIIFLYMRGDPEVESPRSQMDILEELLRQRGFRVLVPLVRDFEKYNEARFLEELQKMMVPFAKDEDFAMDWFRPVLLSNLSLIFNNRDMFNLFDVHIRKEFGYRLKAVDHVNYGIRPERTLRATSEEEDVCYQEEREVALAQGMKTFTPLRREAAQTMAEKRPKAQTDVQVDDE